MIQLEQASLRYEDGTEALRDATLTLSPGSLHFLTGPSGAGKSSLLRLLYLARRPSAGRISIFGKDASSLSRKEIAEMRRSIGVVFQDHRLLDHLTVYENVALPLIVTGEREEEFRVNVLEMLEWVRLQNKLNALPSSLSGGERQRLAIARAMVSVPEIILADEPTGSVDPEMAERIMALFMEMRSLDHVVLIATHDLRLAEKTGAPLLEIRDGALQAAEPRAPSSPDPDPLHDPQDAPAPAPEDAADLELRIPEGEAEPAAPGAAPQIAKRRADNAPILPWSWSSAWLVSGIVAAMAFLATLVLAVHAGADHLGAKWTEALDRRATLSLTPTGADGDAKAAISQTLALARATEVVLSAEPLPASAADDLLRRALGEHAGVMPQLHLIDLRLSAPSGAPQVKTALAALRDQLASEGLDAEIEAHGEWIEKLRPAARMVLGLAETALIVIGGVCALTVTLACSMAMAAQTQVIDLLRLVGAYDAYVARLFVRRFQILAFAGGVAGVVLGASALFLFQLGGGGVSEASALAPLAPELALDAGLWVRFALTPLALALITSLAARLFVEARLRRMEG